MKFIIKTVSGDKFLYECSSEGDLKTELSGYWINVKDSLGKSFVVKVSSVESFSVSNE